MEKRRLLERIRSGPRTVRPEELCRLLEQFGYERKRKPARGSHIYRYSKPGHRMITFPDPHPGKEVNVHYVRRIIKILELEMPEHEG